MKTIIRIVLLFLVTVFLFSDVFAGLQYHSVEIGPMQTAERAKILEVFPRENGEDIRIQILTGQYKDRTFIIENNYYQTDYYVKSFKVDNRIIVQIDRSNDIESPAITVLNYARDTYSFYLAVFFLLLLAVVGKKQGIKSAVSLIITVYIIVKVMLPMILAGYNPILSSIVCCMLICVLSLLIITGISLKSAATILGTITGVIAAGGLAYLVSELSRFSGLNDEDSLLLLYVNGGAFNITGILFAGIIIGTLGAVMDVSMSISSSMYEIRLNNPDISKMNLIKSGLNIGKDVMGTMANTLILAYVGTAIPLMMFSINKQTPLVILLNSESISTEILRALSGSIGIILSMPATSFIFAMLIHRKLNVGTAMAEINLRSSPELGDNRISKLKYKEKLVIIDRLDDWYQVKRENGEAGWVREDGVTARSKL